MDLAPEAERASEARDGRGTMDCECRGLRGCAATLKKLVSTTLVFLALTALVSVLAAGPAAAKSSGNACIKEATGLNNPSCSANDVRVGKMELVPESGP